MIDPFSNLDSTLDQVWQRLARGVADRRSPARHPVLATVGPEGGEARVVVLRGVNREAHSVELHTDTASGKVVELRANPGATLLIWDERAKFQIRLRVSVTVTEGDATAWARIPDSAREVYGGSPPPATPLTRPTDHAPGPTPERFTVLTCTVREIETLHLGTPHKRACFRDGDATWLAP